MSLPWGISGQISVLAPVTTVTEAAAAAAAGASLVDVGDDGELIPAIRDASCDVRIIGRGAGADLSRDVAAAARTGAGLICPDPDAAARAAASGITAERILVVTARPGYQRPSGPVGRCWSTWTREPIRPLRQRRSRQYAGGSARA